MKTVLTHDQAKDLKKDMNRDFFFKVGVLPKRQREDKKCGGLFSQILYKYIQINKIPTKLKMILTHGLNFFLMCYLGICKRR